jgi:nitrogen fixation/metabolism regulation signal transduction histidine kinase
MRILILAALMLTGCAMQNNPLAMSEGVEEGVYLEQDAIKANRFDVAAVTNGNLVRLVPPPKHRVKGPAQIYRNKHKVSVLPDNSPVDVIEYHMTDAQAQAATEKLNSSYGAVVDKTVQKQADDVQKTFAQNQSYKVEIAAIAKYKFVFYYTLIGVSLICLLYVLWKLKVLAVL